MGTLLRSLLGILSPQVQGAGPERPPRVHETTGEEGSSNTWDGACRGKYWEDGEKVGLARPPLVQARSWFRVSGRWRQWEPRDHPNPPAGGIPGAAHAFLASRKEANLPPRPH